ncbi:hypothetical protein KSP40_PGU010123 [Platanthera guangdongensis]|uniref:Uncharacterized protein n=1 Tax=Platanthera guangdongensis TaxID=2320717 RepID=A0ABR2LD65_9ASPA
MLDEDLGRARALLLRSLPYVPHCLAPLRPHHGRQGGRPPASASKKRDAFAIIESPIKRHRRPLAKLPPLSNIAQKQGKRPGKQPAGEDDPQICVSHAAYILSYLQFRETVQMKNVSASMTGILVDWLVEHRSALTMAGKEDVPPASASKKRTAFAIIDSPVKRHCRPLAELPPLSNIA